VSRDDVSDAAAAAESVGANCHSADTVTGTFGQIRH